MKHPVHPAHHDKPLVYEPPGIPAGPIAPEHADRPPSPESGWGDDDAREIELEKPKPVTPEKTPSDRLWDKVHDHQKKVW